MPMATRSAGTRGITSTMEMALPKWKAAAPVATMESIILGTPPPQLW